MKATFILIITGALGTVTERLIKGLEDLGIRGLVETIEITWLLRSARILRRVLETSRDLLSLRLQERPTATADMKFSQEVLIITDFARELKKIWNMKITFIPIIIGALSTVIVGLIKGLEDLEIKGRVKATQRTGLLRSARILRRVREIKETCCHSESREITSSNPYVKNTHEVITQTSCIVVFAVPVDHRLKIKKTKKCSCPTTQLRKILTDNTTILEHQNNKQKLQILEALHIRNLQPTLNKINYQTSANVLKCL